MSVNGLLVLLQAGELYACIESSWLCGSPQWNPSMALGPDGERDSWYGRDLWGAEGSASS